MDAQIIWPNPDLRVRTFGLGIQKAQRERTVESDTNLKSDLEIEQARMRTSELEDYDVSRLFQELQGSLSDVARSGSEKGLVQNQFQ